jgi:hypothetical protein
MSSRRCPIPAKSQGRPSSLTQHPGSVYGYGPDLLFSMKEQHWSREVRAQPVDVSST